MLSTPHQMLPTCHVPLPGSSTSSIWTARAMGLFPIREKSEIGAR
nr:hypothetical protein [Candidatus Sigynarchaeum springense]